MDPNFILQNFWHKLSLTLIFNKIEPKNTETCFSIEGLSFQGGAM